MQAPTLTAGSQTVPMNRSAGRFYARNAEKLRSRIFSTAPHAARHMNCRASAKQQVDMTHRTRLLVIAALLFLHAVPSVLQAEQTHGICTIVTCGQQLTVMAVCMACATHRMTFTKQNDLRTKCRYGPHALCLA